MKNKQILNKFILVIFVCFAKNIEAQNYPSTKCKKTDSILCTSVSFPENWKNKGSRKISLPIKIYKSKSKNPLEPIFWLSGGPGQTNLNYVPNNTLLENHDVILIGYRGVDGSHKLQCPEVTKSLKGLGNDLLSEASVENIKNSAVKCASRLIDKGYDLNGYTIEQVLFDLDSVRRSFNLEKINFLSGSYGTRVAQLYSRLYPKNVNKSVMFGAGVQGGFVWEPEIIDKKIKDYDLLCKKNEYCNDKTNGLYKTLETVLSDIPKRWFLIPIDEGKVKAVTFAMLYHRDTAIQVIDAFIAAEKGDYSGIALMSIAYNYMMPDIMIWGDFFSKGFIDYQEGRSYWKEFSKSEFMLGSPLSSLFMDVGKVWPTKQPEYLNKLTDSVYTNTLILQGKLDFSTPHELIERELLPKFPNAKILTFDYAGHVSDLLYKKKIVHGIKEYYSSGNVVIAPVYSSINFKVDYGFPEIMKISLAILAVVLLIIFFLIRWLMRKFLKRRKTLVLVNPK